MGLIPAAPTWHRAGRTEHCRTRWQREGRGLIRRAEEAVSAGQHGGGGWSPKELKPILAVGILLLASDVGMLAYQGISYTQQENIAQLGPVHVTKGESKTIHLPPVLGATAVGVGVIPIVAAVRRLNASPDRTTMRR